jgi:hypothetical protein
MNSPGDLSAEETILCRSMASSCYKTHYADPAVMSCGASKNGPDLIDRGLSIDCHWQKSTFYGFINFGSERWLRSASQRLSYHDRSATTKGAVYGKGQPEKNRTPQFEKATF